MALNLKDEQTFSLSREDAAVLVIALGVACDELDKMNLDHIADRLNARLQDHAPVGVIVRTMRAAEG